MSNQPLLSTELSLDKELIESSVVHKNVAQEFVVTTSDKIRICLRDYQAALKAQNDWLTPLGILLTLLASLVAADFRQFLGLSSEIWKATFIVGSAICFIWLAHAVCWAIKLRKASDVEYIIERLKKSNVS
jgi:hypothetical protein